MCTKNGIIKKTTLEAYSRPRLNGINAVTVRDGDVLLEAILTNGDSDIIIAKKSGKAIRFHESKVRPMGRTASGVKGITLENESDEVIGMLAIDLKNPNTILVVSEKGFGKRSFLIDPETGEDEYRITGRGGKGVKTLNITDKTGNLIAIKTVNDDNDLMIILKSGIAIRLDVKGLRVMGRATKGVKLIKMSNKDEIASVAVVEHEEIEETEEGAVNTSDENNGEIENNTELTDDKSE
jgi:DNA gyrase subunit A